MCILYGRMMPVPSFPGNSMLFLFVSYVPDILYQTFCRTYPIPPWAGQALGPRAIWVQAPPWGPGVAPGVKGTSGPCPHLDWFSGQRKYSASIDEMGGLVQVSLAYRCYLRFQGFRFNSFLFFHLIAHLNGTFPSLFMNFKCNGIDGGLRT